MMPLTSVSSDIETSLGWTDRMSQHQLDHWELHFGVQLPAVFQSPEIRSRSHWALIAYVTVGARNIREQRIAATISVFMK
jgi:hypothetical protein